MTVIETKKCKETIFKDLKNGTIFLYARYGVHYLKISTVRDMICTTTYNALNLEDNMLTHFEDDTPVMSRKAELHLI